MPVSPYLVEEIDVPHRRERAQHLEHHRVVVKLGTNMLTARTDQVDARAMADVIDQVVAVRERGGEVIIVTSGAIAAGRQRLEQPGDSRRNVLSRQVLAAVGQSRLMALWDELFDLREIVAAQALLTRRDLADRLGYLNARNTLLGLLEAGVVPVVNENDVVAVDEILDSAIGDNDNLSAQVANLVDADLLLLLTDRAGLYTADPAVDPDARLIEVVEEIDAEIERAAGSAGQRGTGGMVTKLQAARIAMQSGTHIVIADGAAEDVVLRAAAGEPVGTHFVPRGSRVESRRRFLLSGLPVRGRIVIDEGAARAIAGGGKSLLPAGIVEVGGTFERGDVVQVLTEARRHIASGRVNYASSEVLQLRGIRSDRIAEVLGYTYGEEVVHRNNLALV